MASGRIVVVAGLLGVLGAASTVIGIGPLVQPADPAERAIAVLAIGVGATMMTASLALALRRGPARVLGLVGSVAMVVLGVMVVVLAGANFGGCGTMDRSVGACYVLVGAVALLGLSIAVSGVAAVAIIRRARPDAFRRHGRHRRVR